MRKFHLAVSTAEPPNSSPKTWVQPAPGGPAAGAAARSAAAAGAGGAAAAAGSGATASRGRAVAAASAAARGWRGAWDVLPVASA
ncbi:hypothetical protein [Streptomyces aculeolatus]